MREEDEGRSLGRGRQLPQLTNRGEAVLAGEVARLRDAGALQRETRT